MAYKVKVVYGMEDRGIMVIIWLSEAVYYEQSIIKMYIPFLPSFYFAVNYGPLT